MTNRQPTMPAIIAQAISGQFVRLPIKIRIFLILGGSAALLLPPALYFNKAIIQWMAPIAESRRICTQNGGRNAMGPDEFLHPLWLKSSGWCNFSSITGRNAAWEWDVKNWKP
jgi:hypothetical protein